MAAPLVTADTARHEEIGALANKRNAVILAHNHGRPEVQDVADYVGHSLGHFLGSCLGSSLGLSREAARTDADASLPDLAAGCSLASAPALNLVLDFE